MFSYLFTFSIALAVSLLITPLIRNFARKKGWVDNPDGKRKLHRTPIPRIGGVGIYFALVIALLPVFLLPTDVAKYLSENLSTFAYVIAFSGLIMLIGLWDDLHEISPWKKLAAQSLVAVLCWWAGFRILVVWAGDRVELAGILSLFLTVLWIVGITNAFNLIDGMDGLAAGSALFAILAIVVVSVTQDLKLSALVLFALAGSTLGFLRYNFNPASIFLGDSGSYLLGFVLALISMMCSQKSTTALAIAVPLVALGLPVVDTGLAVVRRFLKGKPIFSADRRHVHHILVERGLNTRRAVILLYGISGLFGLFSLCFINPSGKTAGVVLAVLGICVILGVQQLGYSELHGLRTHFSRGLQNQRRLLAGGIIVEQMIAQVGKAKTIGDLLNAIGAGLEELCFSRFELVLRGDRVAIPAKLGRFWEAVSLAEGGTCFRWSSPCATCARVLEVRHTGLSFMHNNGGESPCGRCQLLKNPILQKDMHRIPAGASALNGEYLISLPVTEADGSELGKVGLYHRVDDENHVSAISVLSRNTGRALETSLQRILVREGDVKESEGASWIESPLSGEVKHGISQ